MALSSVSNFIANIDSRKGNARSDRFYVQFSVPNQLSSYLQNYVQSLTFQCSVSELPGQALETAVYRTYGPPKEIPTIRVYNYITFSLYCTNLFFEKPFFDAWVEFINPRNTGWDFRYKDNYVTDLNIIQLGLTDDSPIYSVQLIRAFPKVISPMPLNWEDGDFHILDVSFGYEKYAPLVDTISNKMSNDLSSLFSNIA